MTRFFDILISGSIALLLLPTLCHADPLAGDDWSGGYIGGNLDFQRGVPIGSGLISVHVGTDRQIGDSLFGAELEVSDADAGAPNGGTIDWMTRAKLRAGIVRGRAMIYATAGGVRADSTTGPEYGFVAGAGVEYRFTGHWTVGGEVLTHHFPGYDNAGSHDVQSLSARVAYRF